MSDTRKVYGGIYIDDESTIENATEFGIYLGGESTVWFEVGEHAHQFDQLSEIGGMHHLKLVEGYTFGIHKGDTPEKRTWHVRDSGHKNCKHILWQGTYEGDTFVRGVEKFIKQITG